MQIVDARADEHRAQASSPLAEKRPVAAIDPATLAAEQIDLAAKLLEHSGTATVSPMSLVGALAAVGLGCDAATRAAMNRALRFATPLASEALQAILGSFVTLGLERAKSGRFPLLVASRLVIDPEAAPVPAFLAGLRGYGVEVDETSLSDPKVVANINDWVRQKTEGLIPSIIDSPPGRGGLVSLNALHFKDRWRNPFDPKNTAPLPFLSPDGSKAPVAMMFNEGTFSFARKGSYAAVDLPFDTDRFAVVFVTKTDGPANAAQLFEAGRDWLAGCGLAAKSGSVTVPRLHMTSSADLLKLLRRLGLRLGPLTFFGATPPSIAAIAQRTAFTMTEEGAEAAAATAVAAIRSMDGGYIKLVLDKPFVFALRDRTTGFVPIAGYVGHLNVDA